MPRSSSELALTVAGGGGGGGDADGVHFHERCHQHQHHQHYYFACKEHKQRHHQSTVLDFICFPAKRVEKQATGEGEARTGENIKPRRRRRYALNSIFSTSLLDCVQ